MSDAHSPDAAEGDSAAHREPPASDPSSSTSPATEPSTTPPAFSEAFGQALAGAARRAGLDAADEAPTHRVVWRAVGGWRGILESIVPSLVFVIAFTVSRQLVLSLVLSLGLAVVFTLVRLIARQPVASALGGLVATAAAAALALWTGRAADNFVWGIITNAVYGGAILISVLVGWSLIGLAVGYLMGEGTAWRRDPRKRRVFFWLGLAWAGLFIARLAVQVPIYIASLASGDPDAGATALGTVKLVMGLPLFAPLVAVTWLVVRALYRPDPPQESTADAAE